MDDAPMLLTPKGKKDTTARGVLQVLAEHARADGSNAHPSVARVQYRTGFDERTVQNALRRLEVGGLIVADGAVNGCTRYRLSMHLRRPASDWDDLVAEKEAKRSAAAERKRKSRAAVTSSDDVTVTSLNDRTGDVTSSGGGRHVVEQRDVTSFNDGRHVVNAPRTVIEPSVEPPENLSVVDEGGDTSGSGVPAPRPDGSLPMAPIDDGFALTDPMRCWAAATVPALEIDLETAQFVAHFRANGGRRRSWPDEWQKWMLRSAKWASERQERPPLRATPFTGWRPYTNPTDVSAYSNGF